MSKLSIGDPVEIRRVLAEPRGGFREFWQPATVVMVEGNLIGAAFADGTRIAVSIQQPNRIRRTNLTR